MKRITIDIIDQDDRCERGDGLPCVECGMIHVKMVHIRMNPVNLGEHPQAMPLGGLYCRRCTTTIAIDLINAVNEILK